MRTKKLFSQGHGARNERRLDIRSMARLKKTKIHSKQKALNSTTQMLAVGCQPD